MCNSVWDMRRAYHTTVQARHLMCDLHACELHHKYFSNELYIRNLLLYAARCGSMLVRGHETHIIDGIQGVQCTIISDLGYITLCTIPIDKYATCDVYSYSQKHHPTRCMDHIIGSLQSTLPVIYEINRGRAIDLLRNCDDVCEENMPLN